MAAHSAAMAPGIRGRRRSEVEVKYLDKTIIILNGVLILLAGVALLAVMGLSVANIVLRMMGVRFGGVYELVGFAGAIVIAAALGQTQYKKDHVPVDIITRRFPPAVNRGIDLLKYILKMVFAVVVAWKMTAYGLHVADTGEVSETLKIIHYPFIFVVAGGFAVLACTVLLDIVRTLVPEPASPAVTQPVGQEQMVEEEVPLP